MKRRVQVIAPAMALALAAASGAAAPAAAAPAEHADAISLAWEAGESFAASLDVPVFGGPRVVPGDDGSRSFLVRNDGPSAGILSASIANVELSGDAANPFYRDLLLNGQPVVEYWEREVALPEQRLEPGESTEIDLSYLFPEEAESGNYAEEGAVAVSFDVELHMQGETDPAPLPPPEPEPQPDQEPQHDDGGAALDADDGEAAPRADVPPGTTLADTGAGNTWLAGAGLLFLLGGLGLALVRRRS